MLARPRQRSPGTARDTRTGKPESRYSPECVEGEFSEIRLHDPVESRSYRTRNAPKPRSYALKPALHLGVLHAYTLS